MYRLQTDSCEASFVHTLSAFVCAILFFCCVGAVASFSEEEFAALSVLALFLATIFAIAEGAEFETSSFIGLGQVTDDTEVIGESSSLTLWVVFESVDGITEDLAGTIDTSDVWFCTEELFAVFVFFETVIITYGADGAFATLTDFAGAFEDGEAYAATVAERATFAVSGAIGVAAAAFFGIAFSCTDGACIFGIGEADTEDVVWVFTSILEVTELAFVADGLAIGEADSTSGTATGGQADTFFGAVCTFGVNPVGPFAGRVTGITIGVASGVGRTAEEYTTRAIHTVGTTHTVCFIECT